jgi:hypothetical protein
MSTEQALAEERAAKKAEIEAEKKRKEKVCRYGNIVLVLCCRVSSF